MIKLYLTLEKDDNKIERLVGARDFDELNILPIGEIIADMSDTLKNQEMELEAQRITQHHD